MLVNELSTERRSRASRWLPYALACAAILLILVPWVEISNGDPRIRGGAADLYGMRFRDDVNVLFILVDTLRADRLGVYGYDRATSPTLD